MTRWPLLLSMAVLLVGCGGTSNATSDTDAAQLALGRQVYEANCASCHGLHGEGTVADWKQPNQDGSFPPPPHDDTGHTWHHSDAQLYGIVANGGAMPNSAMPAFNDILSHEEIVTTLEYIKTFWSKETRTAQAQVSQEQPYPLVAPDQ